MDHAEPVQGSHPLPVGRIGITLAACGAMLVLARLPLPGFRAGLGAVNVGSGLTTILGAFILVEIVAAAVPALRPSRRSAEGRARLYRAAIGVAILLALVKAYGVLRYAQAQNLLDGGSVLAPRAVDARLALGGAMVAATLAPMLLARLIDVAGVGAGYSLLILADIGDAVVNFARAQAAALDGGAQLRLLLPIALFAFAAWRMLSAAPEAGGRARYRIPTAGIEPVHKAVLIAGMALNTSLAQTFFWPLVPTGFDRWVQRGLQLLLTVSICYVLTVFFHRAAGAEEKGALSRAARASAFWLAGLTIGSWIVEAVLGTTVTSAQLVFDAFWVVTLIAVAMDLAEELRAGARLGSVRQLRTVHSLDDADALQAALRGAGIEIALRGARHRLLFQFFAPFIPIGVLVAAQDMERAEVVAAEHERALAEPPPLPA